jgi:hypothetical protein
MRALNRVVLPALTAFVIACDQHDAVPDVDPMLGVGCFESHRASLQPGTQYEGIEGLSENQLTIRIMNGVEVVTLDCRLNPDGTLEPAGD